MGLNKKMKQVFYIFTILLAGHLFAQNDSLNITDQNQLKQGPWIQYFENSNQVFEAGTYLNNLKTGLWKQFTLEGLSISEITYINDKPNGYAKLYHSNGQLAEEGLWKEDIWVGNYKSYYENGTPKYTWNFSEEGYRTGKQEYFHENGNPMITGNWNKGKETGVIKRFNESGALIEEQTFDNGKINPELTVLHTPKISKIEEKQTIEPIVDTTKIEALKLFNATGVRKLFDKKKRLWQEGYFKEGQLINGKKYFYNSNNEIIKTEIFYKGKISNTKRPETKLENQ